MSDPVREEVWRKWAEAADAEITALRAQVAAQAAIIAEARAVVADYPAAAFGSRLHDEQGYGSIRRLAEALARIDAATPPRENIR